MSAYYNEIDPQKAEWIRQLIKRGVIPEGDVDERSIVDVRSDDVKNYVQRHWFAGIAIWAYSLRIAGWPDDKDCDTGSAPCQPFSVAGKQKGTADERHLWPAWFRLISERRPLTIFGEQVSDGDGQTWLDLVQVDLESVGYRFGSLTLPAAGFGAPHERHRTIFVADTAMQRTGRATEAVTRGNGQDERISGAHGAVGSVGHSESGDGRIPIRSEGKQTAESGRASTTGDMAQPIESERRGRKQLDVEGQQPDGSATGRHENTGDPERDCEAGDMADVVLGDPEQTRLEGHGRNGQDGHQSGRQRTLATRSTGAAGSTNGHWSNALWLPCSDGKSRAVEPVPISLPDGLADDLGRVCNSSGQSYFHPLQSKAPAKKLRLTGYGDGIVAQVAAAFIKAYLELETLA